MNVDMDVGAKRAASSSASPAARISWTLFAWCIFCQLCAGHIYWFPSVGPGLRASLSLTQGELTAVLAAANCGSVLGFTGGLLYGSIGARKTTVLGALGSALAYSLLGLLVYKQWTGPLVFAAAFLAALLVVTCSYFVYGSSMAVVTEAFNRDIRGRIMALHSAMFGMSAGVLGILQEALFPNVAQTHHLLFFVAAYTLLPAFIAYKLFPDLHTDTDRDTGNSENSPLLTTHHQWIGNHNDNDNNLPYAASNQTLIISAFAIALSVAVLFQIGIYLSWTQAEPFTTPAWFLLYPNRSVRPQSICAIALVSLLSAFLLLPRFASATSAGSRDIDVSESPGGGGCTPFTEVMQDIRYQLIFLAFFIIPGSGTASLLVNVSGVARSRMSIGASHDEVAAVVRALIIAFSAGSVFSRLFTVAYIDLRRCITWKLFLLRLDSLVMSAAMLVLAFAYQRTLILAAAWTGFAHGTFFAISPSLIATWFGVPGFPLNFAVLGSGVALSAATTASWLPAWNSQVFVQGMGACRGTWCYAPTFCILALLGGALGIAFWTLQERIAKMKTY